MRSAVLFAFVLALPMTESLARQAGSSPLGPCSHKTGSSAIVVVPAAIGPEIAGRSLKVGDYIGAFTEDGLCAGTVRWDGSNTALTIWGNDGQTSEIDGFVSGETISFRAWIKELDMVVGKKNGGRIVVSYRKDVPYYRSDGRFQPGAIFELKDFRGTDIADAPRGFEPRRSETLAGGILLTWEHIASRYDLQIARSSAFDALVFKRINISGSEAEVEGLDPEEQYYWRIRSRTPGSLWSEPATFRGTELATGLFETVAGNSFLLSAPYPNPTSGSTTMQLDMALSGVVSLQILDLQGRLIETPLDGWHEAGRHDLQFDASSLPAGAYLILLQTPEQRSTRTFVRLR
jgi:hypothetical protein